MLQDHILLNQTPIRTLPERWWAKKRTHLAHWAQAPPPLRRQNHLMAWWRHCLRGTHIGAGLQNFFMLLRDILLQEVQA